MLLITVAFATRGNATHENPEEDEPEDDEPSEATATSMTEHGESTEWTPSAWTEAGPEEDESKLKPQTEKTEQTANKTTGPCSVCNTLTEVLYKLGL